VVLLLDDRVRENSYALFRKVMGLVRSDERLWPSARLLFKGAFRSPGWPPNIGDPKEMLDFLRYHTSPQQRAQVGQEPLHHVFRAITLVSDDETYRGLAGFEFTSPDFIDAITRALSNKKFRPLRLAAIYVLPHLDKQLFTSDEAFTDPTRARVFVEAWCTAVRECSDGDCKNETERVALTVLLAIANLPCLRIHVPPEQWSMTRNFRSILGANPPSLQRCTQNPGIMEFIKGIPYMQTPPPWFAMLWMKYDSLSTEVREQLERETRDVALNSPYEFDLYVATFQGQVKRAQSEMDTLEPWDREVSRLRSEVEAAEKVKGRLLELREEPDQNRPRGWFG
jgi:hypothetical protein